MNFTPSGVLRESGWFVLFGDMLNTIPPLPPLGSYVFSLRSFFDELMWHVYIGSTCSRLDGSDGLHLIVASSQAVNISILYHELDEGN